MALFMRGRPVLLVNRPFQGSLGAKAYAGLGTPQDIQYRPQKTFCAKHVPINPVFNNDVSVATTISGANTLTFSAPVAWWGRDDIWIQIRTFQGDFENESIYRPVNLALDNTGSIVKILAGTGSLLRVVLNPGGSAKIEFNWTRAFNCAPLTGFAAVQTAGPTTIALVSGPVSSTRIQTLTINGMSPGTYTFTIQARINARALALFSVNVVIPPVPTSTISLSYQED